MLQGGAGTGEKTELKAPISLTFFKLLLLPYDLRPGAIYKRQEPELHQEKYISFNVLAINHARSGARRESSLPSERTAITTNERET